MFNRIGFPRLKQAGTSMKTHGSGGGNVLKWIVPYSIKGWQDMNVKLFKGKGGVGAIFNCAWNK